MTAHAATAHDAAAGAPPSLQGAVGVHTQKLGMWVFLVSDVMFFTALIGSYIILRWGTNAQWPEPRSVLAIPTSRSPNFTILSSIDGQ